jgi:hypothetical protein
MCPICVKRKAVYQPGITTKHTRFLAYLIAVKKTLALSEADNHHPMSEEDIIRF